jgi:hypothetical protein
MIKMSLRTVIHHKEVKSYDQKSGMQMNALAALARCIGPLGAGSAKYALGSGLWGSKVVPHQATLSLEIEYLAW